MVLGSQPRGEDDLLLLAQAHVRQVAVTLLILDLTVQEGREDLVEHG